MEVSSFEQGKVERIGVVVVGYFVAWVDKTFVVRVGKEDGFVSCEVRVGSSFDFAWEGIEEAFGEAFEEVRSDVASSSLDSFDSWGSFDS